ncbi:hypothetical protein V6B14_22400 (plasmid) [Sporosarcina psychrophila]
MSGSGQLRVRKVRIDKKMDVKPTVPIALADTVNRLSFITDTPVWEVVEKICINGFQQKKVISYLSQNFRRTVRIGNTLYLGDINRVSVKKRMKAGKTERLTSRFKADMHESLDVLAIGLACSKSRACALLIDASVRDWDFVNEFVRSYLEDNIDEERMKELKKVMKYINADNPYDEVFSWAAFLSYIFDEVKGSTGKIQDTVKEFIVHHWKD